MILFSFLKTHNSWFYCKSKDRFWGVFHMDEVDVRILFLTSCSVTFILNSLPVWSFPYSYPLYFVISLIDVNSLYLSSTSHSLTFPDVLMETTLQPVTWFCSFDFGTLDLELLISACLSVVDLWSAFEQSFSDCGFFLPTLWIWTWFLDFWKGLVTALLLKDYQRKIDGVRRLGCSLRWPHGRRQLSKPPYCVHLAPGFLTCFPTWATDSTPISTPSFPSLLLSAVNTIRLTYLFL